MFPSLVPPGKTNNRRRMPSLPTLAIPTAGIETKPMIKSSVDSTGVTLLTPLLHDAQLSSTSQFNTTDVFKADLRRVLGSTDSSESTLDHFDGEGPTTLSQMREEDWRSVFEQKKINYLGPLGEGNGGSVHRCSLTDHPKLGVFAIKTITADPDPHVQRQIIRELSFNRDCDSPYIAEYYGAYLNEREATISIAMQFCEGGSLDALYKCVRERGGRTGERVIGRIARGVLEGLSYLHKRRIIHRDIKPSNILLTKTGQVKICDFGVSGELVNSLAGTFTGTSYYMAPERIQGRPYTVTSDIWSLGLTLMEVSMNRFPFQEANSTPLGPLELLSLIVSVETPELVDEPEMGVRWSKSFRHFLKCCLERDGTRRPGPAQLLDHPWILGISEKRVDMERWITEVWN